MSLKIAFAGNPNCGKTTLFNRITGGREYVGNRAGVTVKETVRKVKGEELLVSDLPGIYSLCPGSSEEKAAVNAIFSGSIEGIVNVVDGTHIERNLPLTLQLLKLNIPMIIAVNMKDELEKNRITPDYAGMERELGVKVIPVSALTGEGTEKLINEMKKIKSASPEKYYSLNTRLKKRENECEITDGEVARANALYGYSEELSRKYFVKPMGRKKLTEKADKLFLNKYFAFPLFLIIMWGVFFITFGVGKGVTGIAEKLFDFLFIPYINIAGGFPLMLKATFEGVFSGLKLVFSFLPMIYIMNLLIAALEDSGYLARVIYISDYYMKKAGLGGRSVIPLLTGFGCTAVGISSARVIKSRRERIRTLMLVPFMPCSGKIPVFSILAASFFKKPSLAVMFIYLLGILLALLLAYVTGRKEKSEPFILELPEYRLPSIKTLSRAAWERTSEFLKKAGAAVFVTAVLLSFLSSYDFSLMPSEGGILAKTGEFLSPLFAPLGFGNTVAVSSLLAGLGAKEAVAVSLGILSGGNLKEVFTPASALSYMTFCLMFLPCIPSWITYVKEAESKKAVVWSVMMHTIGAYGIAFLIYNIVK